MAIRQILMSPVVRRGIAAILAAVAVFAFPRLIGDLIHWLIGLVAAVVGVIEVAGWWTSRRPRDLLAGLALIALSVFIVVGGTRADRALEYAVAALLVWRGGTQLVAAYRLQKAKDDTAFWPATRGVFLLLLAVALIVIPETLFLWVLTLVAGSWVVGGAIVIINTIGDTSDSAVPSDVVSVIKKKSMPAEIHKQVSETIFDGLDSHQGGVTFAALMAFATAIATFGVKADSTAVVIGAMLVAPLMGPIMALSAAILMGWPRRAFRALRRVVIGVAIGVGGAFVMSMLSPDFTVITANSEVLSRTSPTMLDLLIALAAGAAGGYAVTHPQVGNSLPGVAIAVALAPPLAVVGYSLEEGAFSFAGGAFLLFLTNLVGIVVAAGITYIISGYSPWSRIERAGDQARRSLALVGIALLMVAIPLGVIGEGVVHQTTARTATAEVVDEWLGDDPTYELARVSIASDNVTVFLTGHGEFANPAEDLATGVSEALETDITLILEVTPRQETTIRVEDGEPISDP